jgi:two-component system, NtrC family, response regulator AtoC
VTAALNKPSGPHTLSREDLRVRLLVVDDEQSIRKLCITVGEGLGFICLEAESGESALSLLEEQPVHMVLSDMVMPHMSGLEFLEKIKKLLPRTEVALMTGHGSIETAVQAMKLGAYDYITKPFSPLEELRLFLRRMAEKVRLVEENEFLRERIDSETAVHGIVGSSAKIQEVLRVASRLKDTRTAVLISGESGTGKELIARAIHFRGAFANRPFVAVDCGSLVPTLIESELFGYEKGAFTGALKSKEGLFQSADTGSVFLDEIGELPLELQAKLLRVLQEKEVRPVGSNQRVKVDVRIIAATNRDLEAAYKAGTFRKDLYFRLNVVTVHVPALRERRSDIPMLVNWFCERYAPGADLRVSNAAMKALMNYDWPGNVRELENCVERAVALGDGTLIDLSDLPSSIAGNSRASSQVTSHASSHASSHGSQNPSDSAPEFVSDLAAANDLSTSGAAPASTTDLEDIERATIQRVFEQVHGDKALAGRMLGISRATLYRKLKRYNISGGSGSGSSSHTLQ